MNSLIFIEHLLQPPSSLFSFTTEAGKLEISLRLTCDWDFGFHQAQPHGWLSWGSCYVHFSPGIVINSLSRVSLGLEEGDSVPGQKHQLFQGSGGSF